jgi:transcriptional regulator with XRE-family HTH domain
MTINLWGPDDLIRRIATQSKAKRLALNLTQQSLAERSGVSLSVLKKFERTGKISLESLLKLALVLDALNEFADLFKPKPLQAYTTMDQLLNQQTRKRGRK